MKENKKLSISEYTKVLVPAKSYDFNSDSRLLIPYTKGEKIGFVNNNGEVVVRATYDNYHGECLEAKDLVVVSNKVHYGYARNNGDVAINEKSIYGVIDCNGNTILPMEYWQIYKANGNSELFTVRRNDYNWGVITACGTEIVPFGKYNLIDGFEKGFARVKDNNNKWGLINENGEEVLPVEYNEIWNFYSKNRNYTTIVKDGISSKFFFNKREDIRSKHIDNDYDYNDYGSHYGEYAGSYAQDVMGYSDDVINDAFEGEPDAYWNID